MIILNAGLLGVLVAGLAVLGVWASRICGRLAHRCTTASRSNGVLPLALRTGVIAVFILVLVAAVYPVIHARRLETVEVLRST